MDIMPLPRRSLEAPTLRKASHHDAIFRKEKGQRAGKENTKKKLRS